MSLIRMDDNGSVYPVSSSPRFDLYGQYKKGVSKQDQAIVQAYVASKLSTQQKFSLATSFPEPWPLELECIWDFCQDKKLAAFILAYIVMDHVISDNVNWACTKTNIQERDFESNFYWRAPYY